jgi:hypothetical protein
VALWCLQHRFCAASQSRIVLSYKLDTTSLLSGEKAINKTEFKYPSSVYNIIPVVASQSRTVWSSDPDTTSLSSSEKATDKTAYKWPSSVCRVTLQSSCTLGFAYIQSGINFSDRLRIMLFSGQKTRAEQYIWSGAVSIADRL